MRGYFCSRSNWGGTRVGVILLCFAQPSTERGSPTPFPRWLCKAQKWVGWGGTYCCNFHSHSWGGGGGWGASIFSLAFIATNGEGGRGSSSVLLYVHRDHTDYGGGGGGGGGYLFPCFHTVEERPVIDPATACSKGERCWSSIDPVSCKLVQFGELGSRGVRRFIVRLPLPPPLGLLIVAFWGHVLREHASDSRRCTPGFCFLFTY